MPEMRDLLLVIVFLVLTALFVMVPPLNETPVRTLLGIALVFFVPGYVFVSALFPKVGELDEIERLALSMGLSICIVIFIGLGLNYTPWGIRLKPILFSLSAFTFIFTAISAYQRMRVTGLGESEGEREDNSVDGRDYENFHEPQEGAHARRM